MKYISKLSLVNLFLVNTLQSIAILDLYYNPGSRESPVMIWFTVVVIMALTVTNWRYDK